MNNLTVVMLMQMISEENYVPYRRSARNFTKNKKPRDVGRRKKVHVQKVNRGMRKNHNIKQPGFDVQRKSVTR